MKNIIATLIILHNIKSLLRLQRRYTLSIFLSEILGKVLRSGIKSLLTPAHSPTASLRFSNPNVKRAGALLLLREQNMRPKERYFVLAEDVRFELTGRFTARRFSKPLV